MKLEFSRQISEKYSHINFLKGSQVVPCGRTDGQIDMTKLIVATTRAKTEYKAYIINTWNSQWTNGNNGSITKDLFS
jgi:hypothetical protein